MSAAGHPGRDGRDDFQGGGPPAEALPHAIVVLLSWFMPIKREVEEMEYQWRMDYDFRHDAYDRAFGPEFTSHERAVEQTVKWLRARPAS